MTRSDWLVGGDRRTAAAERIYTAATELVARDGMDALDIDALASRVHCSRATIYRCAGGKRQIRDAVMERSAARIVEAVRRAVDGMTGSTRIVTAIGVALKEIRSDPLGRSTFGTVRAGQDQTWLTESPIVARLATDLNGLTDDDTEAVQWIVRVVLSLLHWPVADPGIEQKMIDRFISPAFGS
ncbi:TetR/AcrR family transcriptional regulator [Mycobacterium sp. ITM-2016-00318]|uniref:TetR/AcrR family transcriptional regulator n=1 Tax=Mycobacterium sp. ITM-2016-00318 TaxID=2099693 RepID=UPI000CF914BB|nr:TetR/AcrR family transcriptional regulator [Mycobacterium sp. ITM-2016-00318]WNG91140.1 TetR/AcrR family transcriptional regulator [Mycobacterium sp. ITM-2016-00318]